MRCLPIIVLLLGLLTGTAAASTTCDFSGDDWEASSTRLTVLLEIDGVKHDLHFASLYFMFRFLNEQEAKGSSIGTLEQFSMLDYRTFGTPREQFLVGSGQTRPKGWFLWTNHALPGSSFPYIAAYTDKQIAMTALNEWGGELYDGEEMLLNLFSFFVNRHGLQDEAAASKATPAKSGGGTHH